MCRFLITILKKQLIQFGRFIVCLIKINLNLTGYSLRFFFYSFLCIIALLCFEQMFTLGMIKYIKTEKLRAIHGVRNLGQCSKIA